MADTGATPLRNADFRKLLETPRRPTGGAAGGGATPRNSNAGGATPRRGGGKGRGPGGKGGEEGGKEGGKGKKPYKKAEAKKGEEEEEDKYRDRAEERRRGINADYATVDAIALAANGDVDVSRLTVEESKFLGGDVEHTHLVKGLDYALLSKERQRLQKGEEEESASEKAAKAKEAALEAITFKSPLARSVYDCLFRPPRTAVHEMYQPRRTAFLYEFDNEEGLDTDIPTTLRRSKADCPQDVLRNGSPASMLHIMGGAQVLPTIWAHADGPVLERISKVLSYLKNAAGGRKIKKKEREEMMGILQGTPAPAAASAAGPGSTSAPAAGATAPSAGALSGSAVANDDDDIFGGAGKDYAPAIPEKKVRNAAGDSRRSDGSYFGQRDNMSDIPGPPPRPSGPPPPPGADDNMDLEEGEAPPPPPPPSGTHTYTYNGSSHHQQQAPSYGYSTHQQQQHQYGYGGQVDMSMYQQQQQQGYLQGTAGYPSSYGQQLPAPPATASSKAEADGNKWRARPEAKEAREVDYSEAAYAECYPMQADYLPAVIDSDEEDTTQMEAKSKLGRSRYDFNTEEEWQQYKDTREQLPKAAFQFGVKRGEGRKLQKEMVGGFGGGGGGTGPDGKRKDQKLDTQLQKIERLLADKGHEHVAAFAKAPAPLVSFTPFRGGDEGAGDVPATKKKRI